ncbi:hypothetical protein M3P09_00260 [Gaetbulibacter sp. 2012CJ34-3]|uniref:Uncharacterized protein n=1 Tax=Jejuia spongiicola TaxID=2942207 RepID=A0ABT0Q923_9FLAO|nr:hypothetical protein [Jejuia spongiicola]MCL6293413.1 hypothetical protein [Jejuia spongiicola]
MLIRIFSKTQSHIVTLGSGPDTNDLILSKNGSNIININNTKKNKIIEYKTAFLVLNFEKKINTKHIINVIKAIFEDKKMKLKIKTQFKTIKMVLNCVLILEYKKIEETNTNIL